ncbi:caspase domain-containing protein [Dactylonectria macrodidyma]|uniref:Caspase domain-containing protein n=1 Tax=Dactylonectria macrodidyma TaxID=307937 RepID=A0A9P9CZR5_9HYPO|nr:caspase domain-containing protein [Dactylonectria macrodidyma]
MASPKKWAILIGIDKYTYGDSVTRRERRTMSGVRMEDPKDLSGAVNDVLSVRNFLIKTMSVDPDNIKMLLAPVQGRLYEHPLEPQLNNRYEEPTYENMVRALANTSRYARGDLVYIHFSGHGGQASTVFNWLKAKNDRIDHSLLPTDIAITGKYLRDIELGALLQGIVDVGCVLTVVLDCCHSGGAIRGDDDDEDDIEGVRGDHQVYQSQIPADLPLSMTRVEHWGNTAQWLEHPEGFVVLAACLDYQKAKEIKVIESDGGVYWHGRLTYWLLDTVRNSPLTFSSGAVYDRLRAKIHNTVVNQTPYLVGDHDRFFFSPEYRSKVYAMPVTEVRPEGRVRLGGGRLHCVQERAEYAILPLTFDLGKRAQESDVLARVKVYSVSSGSSLAKFVHHQGEPPLSRQEDVIEGCPAVLTSLPLGAQASVQFAANDQDRWQWFKDRWTQYSKGQLRLLPTKGASFTVTVDSQGFFQLEDLQGTFTRAIEKELKLDKLQWDAADSIPKLVRRLEHLARFRLLKSLENPRSLTTDLSSLVTVNVEPAPEDMDTEDELFRRATTIRCQNGVYEVPERQLFRITVKNNTTFTIGCTILNFTPSFGISITQENRVVLDDLFKVLVSNPERDVGSLRLAKLQEMEEYVDRGEDTEDASIDELDDLLASLRPLMRDGVNVKSYKAVGGDWLAKDIFIRALPSS